MADDPRPTTPLQQTLAAEHAAVYVYGLLGGRLSEGSHPELAERLRSAYDVHRARRDLLRSLLADSGESPVPARAAYHVAADGRGAAELRGAALATEERCATVYAELVAGSTRAVRGWAVDALVDTAVRTLTFGGEASAYPGLPELA